MISSADYHHTCDNISYCGSVRLKQSKVPYMWPYKYIGEQCMCACIATTVTTIILVCFPKQNKMGWWGCYLVGFRPCKFIKTWTNVEDDIRYSVLQIDIISTSLPMSIESSKYIPSQSMSMITVVLQFSVPQLEYPLGGSSKKGSHVYFLLQVFWVILLLCQIVLLFDINVVLTSQ